MKMFKAIPLLWLFMLSGCANENTAMPEVNSENCKRENIMAIEPESLRKEFATKCIGKNPFKPTKSPKSWGDI